MWGELIRRLVLQALRRTDPEDRSDAEYAQLTQQVLDREGWLGAATIARQALGKHFPAALCDALYHSPDDRRSDGPGPLAIAVARVCAAFRSAGHVVDVITTNYDDFLEQALIQELGVEVRSASTADEMEGDQVAVLHAHGLLLPNEKAAGELVLTEGDYHRTAEQASWQERYFRHRLLDSHVLFVGSSLTDPNLLRFLFRYPHEATNVHAVLVEPPDPTAQEDVVRKPTLQEKWQNDLALLRWQSMAVNVLQADYFGQPSQFLFEIARRKDDGGRYIPYGERLDQWFLRTADLTLGLASPDEFEFAQQLLNETAARALELLVHTLSLAPSTGEALVIHLWVRSPGPLQIGSFTNESLGLNSLSMIICSDRQWTTPAAADTRMIAMPTRRAAVEASCQGVPRVHEQSESTHQWNFVLAVPVIIEAPDGRLPVGSVTLNSNLAGYDSCLAHLRQRDWPGFRLLARYLQDWGADLLNPSP